MRERQPNQRLSKKELYNLAICFSAGDEEAGQQLYEAGYYPIAGQLAETGLKNRYKWTYGENPPEDLQLRNPQNST